MSLISYPRTDGSATTATARDSSYKAGIVKPPPLKPLFLKHKLGYVEFKDWKFTRVEWVKRSSTDREKLRRKYDSSVRRNFVKHLTKNAKYLKIIGFSSEEIDRMREGKVPFGYQVHHKIPLDDGGSNDFENLVLIKNTPYHEAVHMPSQDYNKVIRQLKHGETAMVKFPVVDKECAIWPTEKNTVRVILRQDPQGIADRKRGIERLNQRGIKINEEFI